MRRWPATKAIHSKEEASSPTLSLEALILSCAIGEKGNRYMVVTDITRFLHADMEGIVHMILEGEIAELIVKLDLGTYRDCICYNQK